MIVMQGSGAVVILLAHFICHLIDVSVAITCGYPGQPVNGYALNIKKNYIPGEAVQYKCNTKYVLFGSGTRVCRTNGTWTSILPLCDKSLTVNGRVYSSKLIGRNQPLAALDGDIESCAAMGNSNLSWWRVDLGVKHHILAVRLSMGRQTLDHQFNIYIIEEKRGEDKYHRCASFSGRFATTTVIMACKEGRGISGRYVHIEDIRANQKFFILCEVEIYVLKEAYPCGDPEVGFQSEIVQRDAKSVRYECPEGHKMIGTSERFCNQSGAWSDHEPTCKEIICPEIPTLENSIHLISGYNPMKKTPGTLIQYNCKHGYVLIGDKMRVCEDTGQWSKASSKCHPIDCKAPKSSYPGEYYSLMNRTTILHSQAELQCTDGFNKSWDVFIHCEAEGRWNHSKGPHCLKIGKYEEIVEQYSLHFTSGIIIGIISMSLIILCILMALFIIKWKKRKRSPTFKQGEQVENSLSPSASSLIARGHYTPAEDIIWANDGFYCELPTHSRLKGGKIDDRSSQTTTIGSGSSNHKQPVTLKAQPSRETIYEEISKGNEMSHSAHLANFDDQNFVGALPGRTLSQQSISELYAKVDFNKKRESRLVNTNNPHSPNDISNSISCRSCAMTPKHCENLNSSIGDLPDVGLRELPPIPSDQESLNSVNSSQNDSKRSRALQLLDQAIYSSSASSSSNM